MASQYAGWAINPDGYFAMGSGPLRAKARVEHELFEKLRYSENATRGVLVLEGRHLPTDAAREVALQINGIIGGSTPSALVNGRVIQPGEAVESLTLERCETDAAIFRRGEHLLRLPISAQAIRVRLAL